MQRVVSNRQKRFYKMGRNQLAVLSIFVVLIPIARRLEFLVIKGYHRIDGQGDETHLISSSSRKRPESRCLDEKQSLVYLGSQQPVAPC